MARYQLLIVFFLYFLRLTAQETMLSGVVVDEKGGAVVGANAFLRGAYDGASTDESGRFSFQTALSGEGVLVVTYLGYREWEQTVLLTGQPLSLTVRLAPAANALREVVITAGAFEAGDERKSVALRPLDIVTTAGATADIAGALNTLPGTQRVGEEGQLFVRGGAAAETRTLIDGLYVQNPYGPTVPDVPARNRFSPFLFKGTLFSTGGYSAEYGQALSSALILHTRDLAPQTQTSISLMSVGAGLAHTRRWEASSLAVAADYTNLAPYIALVPQRIDWQRPPQTASGQVSYRRQTSLTGMLKVQGSAQRSRLAMRSPAQAGQDRRQTLDLREDNTYINATYQEVLGERWSVFAGAAYSFNERHIREQFRLFGGQQSAQGRVRVGYHPGEKLQVKAGGEYLFQHVREAYADPSGASFHPRFSDHYVAAFAEADLYLTDRLVARIGGRAEHSRLLRAANWAPRASLAWKTGDHGQVSLAYGRFFQSPENDLLRYNRNLGFEQAVHYIANYQWERDRRLLRIEGYYKRYDNLVRFPSGAPVASDNSGDGYARGIDLFYRDGRSVPDGEFWVSYSLLDTRRHYRDFPMPATPYFASRHNLSLVYKHWLSALSSSVGLTWSVASPRPYHDPNTDGFNTGRTPTYQDLSANISYLTRLFGQFTILYASVTNIPGFGQTFGYRFSTAPGEDGRFAALPVTPPARRFFFLGLFVSIGGEEISTP